MNDEAYHLIETAQHNVIIMESGLVRVADSFGIPLYEFESLDKLINSALNTVLMELANIG